MKQLLIILLLSFLFTSCYTQFITEEEPYVEEITYTSSVDFVYYPYSSFYYMPYIPYYTYVCLFPRYNNYYTNYWYNYRSHNYRYWHHNSYSNKTHPTRLRNYDGNRNSERNKNPYTLNNRNQRKPEIKNNRDNKIYKPKKYVKQQDNKKRYNIPKERATYKKKSNNNSIKTYTQKRSNVKSRTYSKSSTSKRNTSKSTSKRSFRGTKSRR